MAEQKPIGVISIGSNDIHLLVATSDGIGAFDRQANQSVLAELVGAVKGGVVPAKALGQALQDLEMLGKVARSAGASPIIALATEALREVANGPAFIDLVGVTLGIQATLISGEVEAALDYCWATFPPVPPMPLLVVDSGGGSTQVILGEGPTPVFARSLPVGAGNMTQQFLAHDPPTEPKQHRVTQDDLHHALHTLQKNSAREIAHNYDCPEDRAHLLAAGAVILLQVLSRYGLDEASIKPNGIRGGLVVSYARHGDDWKQALPILPATRT